MTKLYAMDLRPFAGGLWRKDLDLLPTERKERALACRKEEDSMRIACAGYLLQSVLSEEGIEEEGTHEQLLAKEGIYAHLYQMQFAK